MQLSSLNGRDVAWKPLPKQKWAMECPAFELLYGGSKGGAKTNYLAACALPLLALAHQKYLATGKKQMKCRIMVFRKNLDDLADFIVKSHEIYPVFDPEMGTAGFNRNEKAWRFTSGATLQCRHLDGPTDHLGYNGNEFAMLLFDEVQQIPYEAYSFLVAQVRSSDPDYRKMLAVRCTANPGGYDWIIKHFGIDQCPEGGKIFRVPVPISGGRTVEITRAFIRSWLRDNPYLDPDGSYEAQLRATMNEDEVAMYLEGDFFRVAGSYFSHLLRPSVHFQMSRPIPDSWQMAFAIDWGSTNPASCHVGALDEDHRLWIIDELHMPGVTGKQFGEQMLEFWDRQKWCPTKKWRHDEFWGVIDKQAFDSGGGIGTAGDGIADAGFRIFHAEKDRHTGCNQLKERLLLNRDGSPQLVVFRDRCPELVKAYSAIPSLAPKDPEDYDPKSPYAHAMDSCRFLHMVFPTRKRAEVHPQDAELAKWDRLINAARARQRSEELPDAD